MSRATRIALCLVAAKQDIVALGFPEIISRLLHERYGKLAYLIARWYKQARAPGFYAELPNWWQFLTPEYGQSIPLGDLTRVYEKGVDPESFVAAAEHAGMRLRPGAFTPDRLEEGRRQIAEMIRAQFFEGYFFSYGLIQDITSGKLTDLAPYKRLSFEQALLKYDRRRHFDQTPPVKVYENGFKWIDTGKKSVLLSSEMRNCGSVGLMSMDPDRTILTLFGPNNKPHVMVTYSPNEKRISGDECAGSTPVKSRYHGYILDLAESLGVEFDELKSKSNELRVKYLLRNKAQGIESLSTGDTNPWDSYFRFTMDGQEFYTNGDTVVSGEDVEKIQSLMAREDFWVPAPQKTAFKTALVRANMEALTNQGIRYLPLRNLVGG